MRTMAQKRAAYALSKVHTVNSGKTPDEKKDFKSFSAGAPAMILQNGFGQSLAFWFAKGTKDGKIRKEDKNIVLFDIVKDWLSFKEDDVNNLFTKEKDRRKFIVELTGMDQQKYLSAQNEALALLDWVKRFAAADLE